jgi:hypothetical protein
MISARLTRPPLRLLTLTGLLALMLMACSGPDHRRMGTVGGILFAAGGVTQVVGSQWVMEADPLAGRVTAGMGGAASITGLILLFYALDGLQHHEGPPTRRQTWTQLPPPLALPAARR